MLGHIARMPADSDSRQALLAQAPPSWKRPRGRPRSTWLGMIDEDLAVFGMDLNMAITVAENRTLWRNLINSSCNAPIDGVGDE